MASRSDWDRGFEGLRNGLIDRALSCRLTAKWPTVPGAASAYHLLNGLTACSDLFEKFGGHSHAAGITIRPERIEEFRRRLNEHAGACLTPEDLEPSVNIDLELRAENVTFS
jgi:single-stranded-DNA-specific exonuclease